MLATGSTRRTNHADSSRTMSRASQHRLEMLLHHQLGGGHVEQRVQSGVGLVGWEEGKLHMCCWKGQGGWMDVWVLVFGDEAIHAKTTLIH